MSGQSFDELMTEANKLFDIRDHAQQRNETVPAWVLRRLDLINQLISNEIMDEYLELTMQN